MSRHPGRLAVGALLALGIGLLAINDEAMAQPNPALQDVLDLAKDIEAGKPVAKKAAAIHGKHEDGNELMKGLKPRNKGGIGVGPNGPSDGIEYKLNLLGKRALKKSQFDKEKLELLRMAYINLAYAEIVRHYAPRRRTRDGKGGREWRQYTTDWKAATNELLGAIKKDSPEGVKKASNKITNTCNGCHEHFRDFN
jgi:hypothetical protein